MRSRQLLTVACSALGIAFGTTMKAESQEGCLSIDGSPEARIAACTAVINVTKPADKVLAEYFSYRAQAHYEKADYAAAIDDIDKAIGILKQATDVPRSALAQSYLAKGRFCYQFQRFGAAVQAFGDAIALVPGEEAYLNRAAALIRAGNRKAALDDYSNVIRLNSTDVNAWLLRGQLNAEMNNMSAALHDSQEGVRLARESNSPVLLARALNARGLVYRRSGEATLAAVDFSDALRRDPSFTRAGTNYVDTVTERAVLSARRNDFQRAGKDIDDILRFATQSNNSEWLGMATLGRGMLHYLRGEIDAALIDFTEAARRLPNNASAHNNRGSALYFTGQLDLAVEELDLAIKLNPKGSHPHRWRGLVFAAKGDMQAALSELSKAIELNPKYFDALKDRGDVYFRQGEYEKAIKDYQTSIEAEPGFTEAYVNLGAAFQSHGDYAQAVQTLDLALKKDADNATALYNRGLAKQALGDVEGGNQDTSRARSLVPNIGR